jgi:putative FmdB family regulatory protein
VPIYVHSCLKCGEFEDFRKIARARQLPKCPACGRKRCKQVFTTQGGNIKVVGVGDTCMTILNDDGTPYRFKTGTEAAQKKEIKEVLNKREAQYPEHLRRTFDVQ